MNLFSIAKYKVMMVLVIRRMIALPNPVGHVRLPEETITSCQHCYRSDGFIIGPFDFSDQIRERTMLVL